MVHTAVVLPRDLVERLKRDAGTWQADAIPGKHTGKWEHEIASGKKPDTETRKPSGRGLSTEIRRRLQLTYDQEGLPSDPPTSDLVEAVKNLADNLAGDLGKKWHEHPYTLAAFKAGVATFLAQYQPDGDASRRPDTRVVGAPDDPADAVGRTHARLILVASGES